MENQEASFECWAVVQIYGHTTYAGYVAERNLFGKVMCELTVPEVKNQEVTLPSFTKVISPDSIFDITPVSEEYAKIMAVKLSKHPIEGYEHKAVIQQLAKKATEQMTLIEMKNLLSRNPELTPANGTEETEDLTF